MGTLAYCNITDLDRFIEDFAVDYFGSGGTLGTSGSNSAISEMNDHYRRINTWMDSLGRFARIPVDVQDDGEYPQSLIDLNALKVVFNKARSRHGGEGGELPDWIETFSSDIERIENEIESGNIVFDDEVSVGESGIGAPITSTKAASSGGTLHSNWRGFERNPDEEDFWVGMNLDGKHYLGSDYPRTFVVEIDGTGSGRDVGECTYKWSDDNGKTWEEEGETTDEDWLHLDNNLWIRFAPNTTGSVSFNLGDKWKIRCVPEFIRTIGNERIANQNEFTRTM